MIQNQASFSWLQISDLHVGQHSQSWLWPNLKHLFFSDLKKVFQNSGAWDVVIFSGDLTQSGSEEEFNELTRILCEFWEHFDRLGFQPKFFCVPGNHDLKRPAEDSPLTLSMGRWWEEAIIKKSLWEKDESPYRTAINEAFSSYTSWMSKLQSSGIPLPQLTKGAIPGDISAVIEKDGSRVGLIGLNSAYLQIGEGNFEGRLDLDIRQLLSITDNHPQEWCANNHANLLITHHPTEWLHKDAVSHFRAEINPAGRFTAHIFGHLHTAEAVTFSQGGGASRSQMQGASLFGLRHLSHDGPERQHGYSATQISFLPGGATLKHWPRKSIISQSGNRKIVPDHSFDINDENYVEFAVEFNHPALGKPPSDREGVASIDAPSLQSADDATVAQAIRKISYKIPAAPHHKSIRRSERDECLTSIDKARSVWICHDWGLGADGFIWTVIQEGPFNQPSIYKIDFCEYSDRQSFMSEIKEQIGCSLEQFCKKISEEDSTIILFDDIPIGINGSFTSSLESEIEDLTTTILEYCPGASIFLLSRLQPNLTSIPSVTLKPLDEADTRAYVLAHADGGIQFGPAHVISDLHRLTDGIPSEIDSALKNLKFMTLTELSQLAYGAPTERGVSEQAPRALVKAVSELRESKDPYTSRAYDLLKALTTLPYGETLQRIKRFDRKHAFFPIYARELMERSLIEISDSSEIGELADSVDQQKVLVAPRPVRDYVISLLTDKELKNLNLKAANFYFGDQWLTGSPKLSKAYESITEADDLTLSNPHVIIQRLLIDAADSETPKLLSNILKVAVIYCQKLSDSKRYRNCAAACKDFLSLISPDQAKFERNRISLLYAKSLRMLGRYEESKQMLMELKDKDFDKSSRQQILLNLSLCLDQLGDSKDAIQFAEKVVEIDERSSAAYHAQAIILDLSDDPEKLKNLKNLESEARNKGHTVTANNIALTCANLYSNQPDIKSTLRTVLSSAASIGDTYTAARAAIRIAQSQKGEESSLSKEEVRNLIRAYHYVYNERFETMFVSAHKALWSIYEKEGDIQSLLKLFRHSSFIWRLRDEESNEAPYMEKLSILTKGMVQGAVNAVGKELNYFLKRLKRRAT